MKAARKQGGKEAKINKARKQTNKQTTSQGSKEAGRQRDFSASIPWILIFIGPSGASARIDLEPSSERLLVRHPLRIFHASFYMSGPGSSVH